MLNMVVLLAAPLGLMTFPNLHHSVALYHQLAEPSAHVGVDFSQFALLQSLYLHIFSVISYAAVTWQALPPRAALGTGHSPRP